MDVVHIFLRINKQRQSRILKNGTKNEKGLLLECLQCSDNHVFFPGKAKTLRKNTIFQYFIIRFF